ncbi:MAG: arsenic transporter [Planctomycetes bacterium]|nr:arsenic transporter [Planctomycetota bacterium]
MTLTTLQLVTLILFGATYVSLVFAFRWKLPIVAAACAALLLWPGLMTPRSAWAAVNWNVVLLYFGMLLLTETLVLSKAPAVLAEKLVGEGLSARWAAVLVCIVAGTISIVVENVAAVLIVAPIVLAVARRLKTSPAPLLIGAAVSSNLQGAATMIGDPPSMLLAGALEMNFNDFFWYRGRLGLFFLVQAAALMGTAVLWVVFRRYTGKVPAPEAQRLESAIPLLLLVLLVVALAASSVLLPQWELGAGILCVVFGAAAALWWIRRHTARTFLRQVWALDWGTGFFIIGIFVVVGALTEVGLVDVFARALAGASGGSVLVAYTLLVWGSVAGSAFIDNVPFVAAMLPVCAGLAARLGAPVELLAFGMVVGASVGGNITPIGASANIVAVGIARREGDAVSFGRFLAIGLPFTLLSTGIVYLLLWPLWR